MSVSQEFEILDDKSDALGGVLDLLARRCKIVYHADSGAAKTRSLWRTWSTVDSTFNSTLIVMKSPAWILYALVSPSSH
jgi:hypothetical protein